jgi:transcriptional regulator with XRE-family HTH domain
MDLEFDHTLLRRLRVFHRPPVTQAEMGRVIGFSKQGYALIEAGASVPDANRLQKLSARLGVEPAFFMVEKPTAAVARRA